MKKSRAFEITLKAMNFFYDNFSNNNEFLEKFLKDRELDKKTRKIFKIGYALNDWKTFYNFCKHNNIKIEEAIELGLLKINKAGKIYDAFRNRIIFPIWDQYNNPIGFGGRRMNEEDDPKYLNSCKSFTYNKDRILYGLNFNKEKIIEKKTAILMEGYTDVIMAYKHGINLCLAVCGTGLTGFHGILLQRYVNRVIIILDGDKAGIKAANRSQIILEDAKLNVNQVTLPDNLDPCDFLIKYGKKGLLNEIKKSM